jgi:hypothetical protein
MRMGYVGDWIGLLLLVAIVYVLVRPNSKAAGFVNAVGSMVVAMVRRATDMPTAQQN